MTALKSLLEDMEKGRTEVAAIEGLDLDFKKIKERFSDPGPTLDETPAPEEKPSETDAVKTPTEKRSTESESFVSVKQSKLEQISNLVSELIVARNTIVHVKSMLLKGEEASAVTEALTGSEKRFSRISSDLDRVVRENLRNIRGEVSIDSRVGEFTKIRLLLPPTISVSKGLKVEVSGQAFIIPLENVVTMLCVDPKRIQSHKGRFFMAFKDKTVAIMSLAKHLNLETMESLRERDQQLNIVLLDVGSTAVGVSVGNIKGIEEVVVKPLPGDLGRLPFFSGCAILSDGMVVSIINPETLV